MQTLTEIALPIHQIVRQKIPKRDNLKLDNKSSQAVTTHGCHVWGRQCEPARGRRSDGGLHSPHVLPPVGPLQCADGQTRHGAHAPDLLIA